MNKAKADRTDTVTPRPFGAIKADGRRFTLGVWANGGKRLVLRAVRNVPELGIVEGSGYVAVKETKFPSEGRILLSRGNAQDESKHFEAPAGIFTDRWHRAES